MHAHKSDARVLRYTKSTDNADNAENRSQDGADFGSLTTPTLDPSQCTFRSWKITDDRQHGATGKFFIYDCPVDTKSTSPLQDMFFPFHGDKRRTCTSLICMRFGHDGCDDVLSSHIYMRFSALDVCMHIPRGYSRIRREYETARSCRMSIPLAGGSGYLA